MISAPCGAKLPLQTQQELFRLYVMSETSDETFEALQP